MREHNRHKSDLKHQFQKDFEITQRFVNELDPCGLIDAGAPIDEYDCLTTQLLSAVYSGKTRTAIQDIIVHEMEHHFGKPGLEILDEPYKTKLYNDIATFIDKLEKHLEKKPGQ